MHARRWRHLDSLGKRFLNVWQRAARWGASRRTLRARCFILCTLYDVWEIYSFFLVLEKIYSFTFWAAGGVQLGNETSRLGVQHHSKSRCADQLVSISKGDPQTGKYRHHCKGRFGNNQHAINIVLIMYRKCTISLEIRIQADLWVQTIIQKRNEIMCEVLGSYVAWWYLKMTSVCPTNCATTMYR